MVCLWLYCTSISDLSRYIFDRTVCLSQWFITACLWPYCTSISDLSLYVFDRTVRLSVIYHGMSLTVLYVYHSDLSRHVSDRTVRLSVIYHGVSLTVLYVYQWFIMVCLWPYCTSITVIYHGMSLTVLYAYHSDSSLYVSDRTVRLSQWFIMVCLWLYCTSISDLSRYIFDCTVRLSQWFITVCLWPYCTSISDLSRYVSDCTVRLSQWFITVCLWLYCTARTARFSKKSLRSDVGEIKKMSEKLKKKSTLTPRNVREKSNTVIYYKTPTLTIKRREIKNWDINLYLYICMFLRLSFLIIWMIHSKYLFSFSGVQIKVITKLPNSEQSYKGKVKTHNYINRQNQSTTENCASYVIIFRSLILIFAFVLIYYVKKTMPVKTFSIMWSLPFISLCCIILLIKINLIFWMQAWFPELICFRVFN